MTPRLYRDISASQLQHPALAQTLSVKPHYGHYVKNVAWKPDVDTYSPDASSWSPDVHYAPAQFVSNLQPLLKVLRSLPNLERLSLSPGTGNHYTPEKMSPMQAADLGYVAIAERPHFGQASGLVCLRSMSFQQNRWSHARHSHSYWYLLHWLVSSSQVPTVRFTGVMECFAETQDSKWDSVDEISLQASDPNSYFGSPTKLLHLCSTLRSIEFDFAQSPSAMPSRCGTRRAQREAEGISLIQNYIDSISRHKTGQRLDRVSFVNQSITPGYDQTFKLSTLFPACTFLTLHFASTWYAEANRYALEKTLKNMLIGAPRTNLQSAKIEVTVQFDLVFDAGFLPCMAIRLFNSRQMFPGLQHVRLSIRLGPLADTAKALSLPSATLSVQVASIEELLMGDLRGFLEDARDDLDVEVRYYPSVAEYGRESFVLRRKPAGIIEMLE